jgi:transketolase C-terminal domain/subunit
VQSWLYFPADALQMRAIIKRVFFERGLRFVFSTRAKVPYLLKPGSDDKLYGDDDYEFVPGEDEVILEGKAGYVVSYGDMLYRSYDAVLRVRQEGLDVGLVNKPTLNLVDEQVSADFISPSDLCSKHITCRQSGRSDRVRSCSSLNPSTGRPEYVHTVICPHTHVELCLL